MRLFCLSEIKFLFRLIISMWSKRNRLTVCAKIFEELYWQDMEEDISHHDQFSTSELEELVPGDEADLINTELVTAALENFRTKGEAYYQNVFHSFMDDWRKTLFTVKAVLYTWVLEYEATKEPRSELIGKYIKLTQDIVAGGNTSLVHAILSKLTEQEDGTSKPVLAHEEV